MNTFSSSEIIRATQAKLYLSGNRSSSSYFSESRKSPQKHLFYRGLEIKKAYTISLLEIIFFFKTFFPVL